MPKHRCGVEIGYRFGEELYRIFGTQANAVRRFKCARENFRTWALGGAPGGYMLAKLHYCGGDVLYVLTGKRSIEYGK